VAPRFGIDERALNEARNVTSTPTTTRNRDRKSLTKKIKNHNDKMAV
jgi:hypothetical protein